MALEIYLLLKSVQQKTSASAKVTDKVGLKLKLTGIRIAVIEKDE
jgi:hypothetical protein